MSAFVYFTLDGHLTDKALHELINGEPNELTRLEIAEHLSFCDTCTERYAALLCESTLLSPPTSLKGSVLTRIRKQARIIFFNRYVAAGLAAGFALIFWATGVFQVETFEHTLPRNNSLFTLEQRWSQRTENLNHRLNDTIDQILAQFDWKGVKPNE